MSPSKVVAMLALVIALSFAVPALAGKASPIKVAKKALGLAKKADKRSRTALTRANAANASAGAASSSAALALQKLAGPQPEAVHATTADKAAALDGFKLLPLIKAQPTNGADQNAARAAAPEIALFSAGPIRIYAKCLGFTATNPFVVAEVYIATTQDGVVWAGANGDSGNGFLLTSTPETDRMLQNRASADPTGVVNPSDGDEGPFYAFAPDGTALQGVLNVATKVGTVAGGDGPFPPGGGCAFGGSATAS
jgi:hypothetical protein